MTRIIRRGRAFVASRTMRQCFGYTKGGDRRNSNGWVIHRYNDNVHSGDRLTLMYIKNNTIGYAVLNGGIRMGIGYRIRWWYKFQTRNARVVFTNGNEYGQ